MPLQTRFVSQPIDQARSNDTRVLPGVSGSAGSFDSTRRPRTINPSDETPCLQWEIRGDVSVDAIGAKVLIVPVMTPDICREPPLLARSDGDHSRTATGGVQNYRGLPMKSSSTNNRVFATAVRSLTVRWARPSLWLLMCLLLVSTGCQTPFPGTHRPRIDGELTTRFGSGLGPQQSPGMSSRPQGLQVEAGLSADDAVTLALWNNTAFQESMALLGVSRAQLFNAGLLPDPQFQVFFPIGPKQLEFTVFQSIDALWLRPVRERAAELDYAVVADQMVQNGLNVIRDVRLAHADLLLAQEQLALAEEMLKLRQEIAALAEKRFDDGDISGLEKTAPQIDALQADADQRRAAGDVEAAQARLVVLLGLPGTGCELVATGPESESVQVPPAENLLAEAIAIRPDLRAAEIQVCAAAERLELAECQFMTVDGILDANGRGTKGFEAGPGMRMTLPLWNRNQGNIAIARADLETAQRRFQSLRDQVRTEVLTARARLAQASRNLSDVQSQILPETQKAADLAQKSFEAGGTSYLVTLQSVTQYLTARVTEVALKADVLRARAELERGVGQRLQLPVAVTPAEPGKVDPPQIAPPPLQLPDAKNEITHSSGLTLRTCRPVSSESVISETPAVFGSEESLFRQVGAEVETESVHNLR